MATLVWSRTINTVPTRLVDLGSGQTPRIIVEAAHSNDSLGAPVWSQADYATVVQLVAELLLARGIIQA
jgi:hypothetical protein